MESNFEKFMKAGDDSEEAEFVEITEDQNEILNELSNDNIVLPKRHVSNDTPRIRESFEKDRLQKKIAKKREEKSVESKQSKRYLIRKRAKAVGLDLLPPGRHSKSKRKAWMDRLEQLELEKENS